MARYTKPELRNQIKEELQASDKGGRPGQWSARKSQMLTKEYEKRGGGYEGPRDERQESLRRWGAEDWQTRDHATRARRDGETSRYLPKEAWAHLSPEEQRATDAKKREASRSGRQYVSNTAAAKRARKEATSVEHLLESPVTEAAKLVAGLDTDQLTEALRRERAGRDRKTLIQRLQKEIDKR